jgi:EAL domain-containing protein (putative c-di-GMP-specific phosphodiesterase class I)
MFYRRVCFIRITCFGDITNVQSIISIAHSLNLLVIAEGVESEEQLEFLHTQNCDIAQGYYISRPVPSNEIEKILKNECE